jgi:hypothetical protein
MPRQPNPERIKTLEQQAARIARALRRARSAEVKQARDVDTRRKIIGGALCETHALANRNSEFAAVYIRLVKDHARLEDRWLFGDTFRALLPSHEAESLLADGEVARVAAEKARAEKKTARRAPAVAGSSPASEAGKLTGEAPIEDEAESISDAAE